MELDVLFMAYSNYFSTCFTEQLRNRPSLTPYVVFPCFFPFLRQKAAIVSREVRTGFVLAFKFADSF